MTALYDEYLRSKKSPTLNVAGVNIPIPVRSPSAKRSLVDIPTEIRAAKPSTAEEIYRKYFPEPVKSVLGTIKEGLFGTTEPDITGQQVDTGGLFRTGTGPKSKIMERFPLSITPPGILARLTPKTDLSKYEDRLKALMEEGTEPTKASQIAYLDITHPQMSDYFGRKKVLAEAGATETDIKALNKVATEDVTRAVGGIIDVASFGAGGLSKTVAQKIAATTDEAIIRGLLKTEFSKLSDEATIILSKLFKHLDDPIEVESAFNKLKMQLQVKDLNKVTNQAGTREIVSKTLRGEREVFRLDRPKQLQQAINYGVIKAGTNPESTVKIYRYATEGIKPSDHVSLNKEVLVKKYGDQREGRLQKLEVKVKDLVKSDGTGDEFIYAPSGFKERKFITSAKRVIPEAGKIAGQYVSRSTDALANQARELIASDMATAERVALTGTDDNAVAVASELLKKYADDASNSDEATAMALYDKAAEIANTIAPKLTEQGRAIQAASILGRLTPEGQLRFAAREIMRYNATNPTKPIPELTGEDAQKILTTMKEIGQMEDGLEKAKAFKELQDEISNMIPTPLMKKITTVWKAGLLTGIKTTGLNIFANLSHVATEAIKDIPSAAVDKIASLFTGKRTKTFSLRGLPRGMKEGFKKGLEYFKSGFDERNLASKLDYRKVNFGEGPVANAFQIYTDTVFRVMGSTDQPFYYGALARSLGDQAIAQGLNKGLKGKELIKFAEDLVQNPTEEMIRYATADASTAVFMNETYLGKAASAIQSVPVVGEIVVPFARTPSAVATQVLKYTPLGPVAEIIKQIHNKHFDQRAFSEAVGRGLTGIGALAIGVALSKAGMVALDFPTGEREQKLWEIEGKKPNTIKINGKWRSITPLGPAGNLLLIGAHFDKAFQETGSPTEALAKATFGSLKSFTEQTFLSGIKQSTDAVTDPNRYALNYLNNMVGSLVPTIVSDIARATDKTERRVTTPIEAVKARVPGLRTQLEPKVDVLGKEREVAGNPLEILIDPTRPSPVVSTPVTDELRRLTDAGYKVSPTLLGSKEGYTVLTKKQNTELWKRAGQITDDKLGTLFANKAYKEASDENKGKAVELYVEKSKDAARLELLIKLTQGLQGKALVDELARLKAGKVFTKNIYNKYLDIQH